MSVKYQEDKNQNAKTVQNVTGKRPFRILCAVDLSKCHRIINRKTLDLRANLLYNYIVYIIVLQTFY